MKKVWKRIACSALSIGLATTLFAEQVIRTNAENAGLSSTATSDVAFRDVTGTIDTSSLRESNFNDSVLQATESAPTYETRTVMVTLSGDCLADAAGETSVASYLNTFTGQNTLSDIRKEQDAFLRKLRQRGINFETERQYSTLLNAVAIEVNTQYVSAIKQMAGVESVVITTSYAVPETTTESSSQAVENITSVYETGIYNSTDYTKVESDDDQTKTDYGEGTVVAILDTGLDYTHEAFQRMPDAPLWSQADVTEKLNTLHLKAEEKSGVLETKDVYVSAKVPFAYDYADDDADVYPSYSNHGTHVAGIIGGYTTEDVGYTDKDGNDIHTEFRGVAPDSQLMICKVFTDDLDDPELGGATPEDIIAALEDCVMLGVDVINMSLGTSCGFSTTDDGDDEGDMLNAVYERIQTAGISLVCAASNDYSSGYGGVFGTNLKSNPDSSTVGSPSTFASALSVASISGQKSPYMIGNDTDSIFFEESRDENSNPYDFVSQMLGKDEDNDGYIDGTTDVALAEKEFTYVVVPGTGAMGHYTASIRAMLKNQDRYPDGLIVLIKRGDSTFEEKVKTASRMGARAIIVYNNVAGLIRMNLGEIDENVRIPAVSIDMDAGNALIAGSTNNIGKIKISRTTKAGPFMSEFSSWGPTHDLKLKPEITAHGGEITSTVPGGYGEQSGTSMASPNMAGVMALIRNYVKSLTNSTDETLQENIASLVMDDTNGDGTPDTVNAVKLNRLANQLIMSTATTVFDQAGRPYSPRKQGAGLGSLQNVVEKTSAFLWVDNAESDNRPKLEIGDDPAKTGVIERERLTFKLTNFGSETLTFAPEHLFFTEKVAADGLAIAEQAYALDDMAADWYVNGSKLGATDTVNVAAGETLEISVALSLSADELDYMGEENFPNGMYLEGFLQLKSENAAQCDLSIPFLGFHGDWEGSPMLDYNAYEVAEDEQDASLEEHEKRKASVWATQPYSIYYNEKYILPMGGYVYLYDEDNDDPVYADEKYNAVSRYNLYYGDDNAENYLTTTGIKAVYAGLLRNARLVRYTLTNIQTGEQILADEINRVGKAYSGGGQAVPGNVELELYPELEGLVANGKYRMDFEFFMNDPDEFTVFGDDPSTEEIENANNAKGEYSFTFTVDYEAPVLQDARVRYKTTKDGNGKERQTIYLDVDVYDNHHAQAVLLCYPKTNSAGELVLQLATEYPTPVRSQKENGTTTVSIDITNIYEQYGSQLYLQIDDYAVNTCLYTLDLNAMHAGVLPADGEFDLADGEETLTLAQYETHKVALVYGGNADRSNFSWSSSDPSVANVKNGEIVGLSAGPAVITVSNRKNEVKRINVTVTEDAKGIAAPGISFGVIKTSGEALAKAQGTVDVNAGQAFPLTIETDPWYHPMTGYTIVWSSDNEQVATVDSNGNVRTLKKGIATIEAKVYRGNSFTLNAASVTLNVQDEFDVSNYMLYDYNGVGYNRDDGVLWIPTDKNIMYIGEDAFKDNDNIRKVVIPASVVEIREGAFENCTALEEVYFVSTSKREDGTNVNTDIDWADLNIIYQGAFKGCTNLKKVDLSNVKTITVAQDCFAGCTKLEQIVDMPSIGTMYHRAFKGCEALTSVDLTGVYVMGDNVFENCKNIRSITTGKFTAIGKEAFKNCEGLYAVTLKTPKIGEGAFANCSNLRSVTFESQAGANTEFDIGARAFENCGTNNLRGLTVNFNNQIIRTIGENAFVGTHLSEIAINDSFDLDALRLGGLSFKGVRVTLEEGYVGNKYEMENGVLYNADKTKILFVNQDVTGSFEVPATVTEIGDYAFAHTTVSQVTFANAANLTRIGTGAFYGNHTLGALDLSGATSLTEILPYTFYDTNVANVTMSSSIERVGDYAFAKSAIHTLFLGGVRSLGNGVFESCTAIQTVVTSDTAQDGAVVLGTVLQEMGNRTFADCLNLTAAQLPALTGLGESTFSGNRSLENASFAAGATTTGTYTFGGTKITSFTFAETQVRVGEGMFNGCNELTEVTLASAVESIDAYAFNNCKKLATVNNLDVAEVIGVQAFYNTALTSLNLANVKTIGVGAFATEKIRNFDREEGTYTSILMPVVETIGAYAFLNGGETSVDLPASVYEIGFGAFASSAALTGIKVAADNAYFVALDTDANGYGVLYRYIDGNAQTYEIVCYPANRVQAAENGKKVYTIADGTLYVQAAAFMEINKPSESNTQVGLDGVVLPYSVNAIGDDAFFASGILEYTFESIQAPVLETTYREQVRLWIETAAEQNVSSYYKGYYYTNFETYFYEYTSFGNKHSNLVMYYPTNGVGYDNYIYSTYFGTRTQTSVGKTDATRDCINEINALPSVEEINSWLTWDATDTAKKEYVVQVSETLKSIRSSYNSICNDAAQAEFLTQAGETLESAETAMRAVKAHFNIIPRLLRGELAQSSTCKRNYIVGETFDMTGLRLVLHYDDGSTEEVGTENLTLLTTTPLTRMDISVRVRYQDEYNRKDISIDITVSLGGETNDNENEQPQEPETDGLSTGALIAIIAGGALLVAGGVVLTLFLLKKKKGNVPPTDDVTETSAETAETAEETPVESVETTETETAAETVETAEETPVESAETAETETAAETTETAEEKPVESVETTENVEENVETDKE